MKKMWIIFALLFVSLTINAGLSYAANLDISSWYGYSGTGGLHGFEVRFPTNWQAYTIEDDLQGFGPKTNSENESAFLIKEFQNQTYDQAINYYVGEEFKLSSVTDFIFNSTKEDLTAKKVIYQNLAGEKFSKTFLKRGSLIVALSYETDEYKDILDAIHNSFGFTGNWHHYINFSDRYSFIFPANYQLENINSGVSIIATSEIFRVLKYADTSFEDAINEVEENSYDFLSEDEINLNGIPAIAATFEDETANQNLSKIFIEKDGDTFVITDINVENNFPVSNYYNEYIAEMLQSFEFFEMDFKNFPDIKNEHSNATSINSLVKDGVINGYPDGTFKPDGLINRAELTKMVVATVVNPNTAEFKNCFPDVAEEWFAPYICYAKEQGWVEGYSDGKFKPEASINRVEALKIILNVLFEEIHSEGDDPDKPKDVEKTAWYSNYFTFANINDLLDKQHIKTSGSSYYYYPGKEMTRKEVAETVYRSLNLR